MSFTFEDTLQGLKRGDFSWLEPVFTATAGRRPRILEWYEEGLFRDEPIALAEALTCACFLGEVEVAEYLLKAGIDPSGGSSTGLNAVHWAANRGQLQAVCLLLRWNAPLHTKNMYGGNVLDAAVWSAIQEPRPNQLEVIEELLKAGARLEGMEYPTRHERVDAILKKYQVI
jgi:hypothetical protein